MSLKLQFNDLFDTYRQHITSYDAISTSSSMKLLDTRDLSLTLRYNFNTARSRYKGCNPSDADRNRL